MNRKPRGKHERLAAAIAVGLAALAGSCSRSSRQAVTLAGSTAFEPFAEKLAEHFMAAHPGTQIQVQGGGSAVGVQSALSGAAAIGMADLLTLPPEAKELTSTVVAVDGIAIIVHARNPVSAITSAQAQAAFSGGAKNWKALGGADAPIRVISREEGSGTRRSFDTLVLKGLKVAPDALFQNSNGTVREAVASDPHAVGYVSIGLLSENVRGLAFDGVAPTNENVKRGTYPLARPVYFLTRGALAGTARAFLDYVLSREGQGLLEKEGLISAE